MRGLRGGFKMFTSGLPCATIHVKPKEKGMDHLKPTIYMAFIDDDDDNNNNNNGLDANFKPLKKKKKRQKQPMHKAAW